MEADSLFHVARAVEWADDMPIYEPASFMDTGYVLCSNFAQSAEVMAHLHRGETQFVLLEIDPSKLTEEVRWEYVPEMNINLPHIMGPIDAKAIVAAMPIEAQVNVTLDMASSLAAEAGKTMWR